MKKIILVLFLGLSGMHYAQNKISGKITDNKSQPVSGVSVYAPDHQKGTITDSDGRYNLNNLPAGSVNIIFSYIGYGTVNKRIEIKNETVFDLVLEESVHQMDEVIVSTAFNKLQSQNVMKVEHHKLKSLQQQGISTLAEGLAMVPGVSQISTGISIGKPVIRGLSANRVLVYAQGVRLENQQFGDEHGLGLNDSGIESVEIIKGPASLLYGSDALGGVMYFNPEKFADANTFKGDFSQRLFSNTLGSNASLGLKGSTENWKFLIRGNYSTHADYKTPVARVTNTRYNESDIKGAIGYGNSKISSVLRYNFNRLDLGISEDGIAEQSKSDLTQFPKQGVNNHILSLHNNIFLGDASIDVNIGYIFNDRREFEDNNIPILHMKLETINYDLKYRFPKFNAIEVIAGIQGMHQTNTNLGEELLIPDATIIDSGIFGTANYEWETNVVQAGLRYDNRKIKSNSNGLLEDESNFQSLNKSFDSFNASLGYKGKLNQKLTMRLNLASGFRAPNLAELTSDGVHEGSNRYEIGNINLKTEQNIQVDLNLEFQNSHFEFFANGFYNQVANYIYASPTGLMLDENEVFNFIQNDARLWGGEAGIHLHPHPFDWLHFESSFETVIGERLNGGHLPVIPANNWNNTIRTEFKILQWLTDGYARVNISSTFNQSNVGEFETPSSGYTLINAGFGGKIKLWSSVFEMSLNGNNLFNKKYIAHLSRLKPDGIQNIGRNIVLGINFIF